MTETLGYAISKTWYIVLIFVALAIGIAFLSKKKSSKALVALSVLCLVFSVGSFAFGGLTVSEAQSKGASSDQLNSMNIIELVQANQAAPAQTSVNDVNELYNKIVYVYQYGSPISQSLASDNPFVHHDLPWVAATLPELKKLLDKNEVVYVSTNSQIFKQLHINPGENAVEPFIFFVTSVNPAGRVFPLTTGDMSRTGKKDGDKITVGDNLEFTLRTVHTDQGDYVLGLNYQVLLAISSYFKDYK